MVGLVIVSHSRTLSKALVSLARQVTEKDIPIVASGGVGPEHAEFGTDALDILNAIQAVYSPAGVVVLMDLGSAVLSAEMALELLPDEMRPHVRLLPSPIVEGTIAAAVQISLDSDLETVFVEAQHSLAPKEEHLGYTVESSIGSASEGKNLSEPTISRTVTLTNLHGLHARPAAKFVQLAASFDASTQVINLRNNKGPVSARSINSLATLGAVKGDPISISASGIQAQQAVEALQSLVETGFGDDIETTYEVPDKVVKPQFEETGANPGIPVSEGVALGVAHIFTPPLPPIPDNPAAEPEMEWKKLEEAIRVVSDAIDGRQKEIQASAGEPHAAIFEAHKLILTDADMLEDVRQNIFLRRMNAAHAWNGSLQKVSNSYRQLEDPYLQERSKDVEDVGSQVLYVLAGSEAVQRIEFPSAVILIARELTPTQTVNLDMNHVMGLITLVGGINSHSAILARALGIPAISGVNPGIIQLTQGTFIILDGFRGEVYIDPDQKTRERFEGERQGWLDRREKLLADSLAPSITLDGRRIEVAANVGALPDAEAAKLNGAQGIGLLRTEFLFLTRATPPMEDEQITILRQIGETLSPNPVIIRTLDVGGDKSLPFINLQPEENPFLGVRAIRLSLQEPELFLTQLRAILRAGVGLQFRVMFPMVTSLAEVELAMNYLEEAHQSLSRSNLPHLWPIETGIMVETPAAALLSPELAVKVDFFSIGTNDLTQYTLAAERGNPHLAEYHDGLNPAVLRLIRTVIDSAHEAGKWVGVCGELAGNITGAIILIGLGVDELSLNPIGIPGIKSLVRHIEFDEAKTLATRALGCASASEVRGIVEAYLEKRPVAGKSNPG